MACPTTTKRPPPSPWHVPPPQTCHVDLSNHHVRVGVPNRNQDDGNEPWRILVVPGRGAGDCYQHQAATSQPRPHKKAAQDDGISWDVISWDVGNLFHIFFSYSFFITNRVFFSYLRHTTPSLANMMGGGSCPVFVLSAWLVWTIHL